MIVLLLLTLLSYKIGNFICNSTAVFHKFPEAYHELQYCIFRNVDARDIGEKGGY